MTSVELGSPTALGPGTLVGGDFVVESVLARGGMGVVYVATQKSTKKRRALKVMTPQPGDLEQVRRRFEREAHVASQIESDHIVEVIGAGVDPRTELAWMAMELLEGEDLESYLGRRRRLDWTDAWNIVGEACHALEAAHRIGVVHRDLKPSNVFLARSRRPGVEREVKVLDFGIAKRTTDTGKTTGTLGTPLYMAPEQTMAGASFSPATDVWALGLLVFELLVGRPYWRSASADEAQIGSLLREIILEPIVPATERAAELGASGCLPVGFDAWFERCVTREPTARYADAGAAYRPLARILALATGGDETSVPPAGPAARPLVRELTPHDPAVHEARTVAGPDATRPIKSRLGLLFAGTVGGVVVVVGGFLALRSVAQPGAPEVASPVGDGAAVVSTAPAGPVVVPGPTADSPDPPATAPSGPASSAAASTSSAPSAHPGSRPRARTPSDARVAPTPTTTPVEPPPAPAGPPAPPAPPRPPKDPVIL